MMDGARPHPGKSPILVPQVSSARRPGKLPFSLAPEDLAPWSPASLRDRLGPARIPVEYGLAGIYRPRLGLNEANYFRKSMPADAAIERIWFSDHYATSHYVSALDLAELAPAHAPSLPDLRNGSGDDPARRPSSSATRRPARMCTMICSTLW
jgi:hypothetical protein